MREYGKVWESMGNRAAPGKKQAAWRLVPPRQTAGSVAAGAAPSKQRAVWRLNAAPANSGQCGG